jgi:hypothetical protein
MVMRFPHYALEFVESDLVTPYISLYSCPETFKGWAWELLKLFINSSTECCNGLINANVLDAILCGFANNPANNDYWIHLFRGLEMIIRIVSETECFSVIFEACASALFSEAIAIPAFQGSFTQLIGCLHALLECGFECNQIMEISVRICECFCLFPADRVRSPIMTLWGDFLCMNPPINLLEARLLELPLNVTGDKNIRIEYALLIGGLIQTFPECVVFLDAHPEIMNNAGDIMAEGTSDQKIKIVPFLLALTDSAFFSQYAAFFGQFQIMVEWAVLITMASNDSALLIVQGLRNIVGNIARGGFDELLGQFDAPEYQDLFDAIDSIEDKELRDQVDALGEAIANLNADSTPWA